MTRLEAIEERYQDFIKAGYCDGINFGAHPCDFLEEDIPWLQERLEELAGALRVLTSTAPAVELNQAVRDAGIALAKLDEPEKEG